MRQALLKKVVPPVVLTVCFLVGFWTVIQKLLMRWNNGDDNYCYLIVPLFLYLCWEKKGEFRFSEFSWTPWGILPGILSSALIVVGELGSVETFMYIGLWGCISSTIFTLYGRRTRFLAFPLLILLFIVPLPPFINKILTFKLKMIASSLSVEMLRLVGISVVQEGNLIDLGIDRLQVADACSGLRYFLTMILMGLLVAYFFTRGLWRKSLVLLLILPLAIFVNVVRIFFIGLCVVHGHRELAQNLYHDFSGWLAFVFAGIILVAVALMLKRIGTYPPRRQEIDEGPAEHRTRFAVTGIILCAVFLMSGIGLAKASSTSHVPPRASFESFPMQIGQWEGTRDYLSEEVMQSLWADDYVSASYQKKGSPNIIHLLIPYYSYQGTRHTVHAPQSCLLGGGWSMLSSCDHPIPVPGKVITARVMVLEKDERRLIGSYFFLQRGRVIASPWMNKWYLLEDSVLKRRTDGALVRVELLSGENESVEGAREELESFIAQLWPTLHTYVPD